MSILYIGTTWIVNTTFNFNGLGMPLISNYAVGYENYATFVNVYKDVKKDNSISLTKHDSRVTASICLLGIE